MSSGSNILKEQLCKVCKALAWFFQEDTDLLDHDVNERSITHKIAEHLQKEYERLGYKVDCEYNREGHNVKRLNSLGIKSPCCSADDTDAVTVYPDIIVHKRGKRDNLLVIEVKKTNHCGTNKFDIKKLKAFTSDKQFRYKLGLFLVVDVSEKGRITMLWFTDGKVSQGPEVIKFSVPDCSDTDCFRRSN